MPRIIAFVSTVLAGVTAAQQLAVYDPVAGGGPGFIEAPAPSPLVPPGMPPVFVYPGAPALPAPAGPLFGDSTFNSLTGYHWFTNGAILASMPTPSFPPAAPPVPAFPIPPAVLGAIGGPVTGIAVNPATGVLFMTSLPGIVLGVAPVPGMPVLVPPFPVPFPLAAPITGLEWDAMSASLYAVDAIGNVYPFAPPGLPTGPVIPPPPLPAVAAVTDVALDKSGLANAAGVRSIWLLAPPLVFDTMLPGGPPLPMPASPFADGLAYVPNPGSAPPPGICACPPLPGLAQGTTGPMAAGNAAFGLTVAGLPPGMIVLYGFDFAFNPAFPFINVVGCGLGLFPGSPTVALSVAFAGPGGVATLPFPLVVPAGTGPLYSQAATLCAADPTGLVLLPMRLIAASGF